MKKNYELVMLEVIELTSSYALLSTSVESSGDPLGKNDGYTNDGIK